MKQKSCDDWDWMWMALLLAALGIVGMVCLTVYEVAKLFASR